MTSSILNGIEQDLVQVQVMKPLDELIQGLPTAENLLEEMHRDLREKIEAHMESRKTVKSDRVHEIDFARVIHLGTTDSCYHFARLALDDLELTTDNEFLYATVKINRHAICNPDREISAPEITGRMTINDSFERRIYLQNGKMLEIKISPGENFHFPYLALESFKVTARW
jgi:hypothetical protein